MTVFRNGKRQLSALSTVVSGSLQDVASHTGRSLAETFIGAEVVALVDVSGSMISPDSRGGRSRYVVACEELARLQERNPGRVAIVGFADAPRYCPGGVPPYDGGGTDLAGALRFLTNLSLPASMRIVVISDGLPNDPNDALRVAAKLHCDIDTVYVGPETEPEGQRFLAELARRQRGRHVTAARAVELAAQVQQLLLATGTTSRGEA